MEEVARKIGAMKADGSSTRARMNAAGNGPFGVFQEFLVEAYEARPAKTKKDWKKLVADAKKQTIDTLVVKRGSKASKVGAKDIGNAIYVNDQSDAYKELVNMVPISIEDLREIMDRARGYVAGENAAYVQKYGSQAHGFSSTEAEATEPEEQPESKELEQKEQPQEVMAREYVETSKERQARIKRERKKAGFEAKKAAAAAALPPAKAVGPLPKYLQRRKKLLERVRVAWDTIQAKFHELPGSQSPESQLEADNLAREMFELETGIDLSNVSEDDSDTIASMLEGASRGFQNLVLSGAKREYLGGHMGGWKALLRNVKATDELDEIAKEHDMKFLLASAERDPGRRRKLIQRADQDMIRQIDNLLLESFPTGANVEESSRVQDMRSDAEKARTALKAKMAMDDYGLSPGDWMTSGVRMLDDKEAVEKTKRLAQDFSKYIESIDREIKQHVEMGGKPIIDLNPDVVEHYKTLAAKPHIFEPGEEEEKEEAAPAWLPSGVLPPEEPKLPPPSEIVPGETQVVQQDPSRPSGIGIKKVPIGLEDVLGDLQKMNREPAERSDIFSLKPVTGERNMRPMLVKGDVENILKRSKPEIVENMDFYANWKFVSAGWGNGNQQALPDQIGMPFKNNMLRAQWDNQDFMFKDNWDVGARDWYRKTYMPQKRRHETIHSKRVNHIYGVPMIRDTQTHQLPTRNGALPAGVGRPIHFAKETSNGWNIFTPNQRLNSRDTRLFNGDVVDGKRV